MRSTVTESHERREGGECALTVAVPFTRAWAVEPFFAALDAADVGKDSAILVYVDSDEAALAEAVRPHLEGWRTAVLHVSGWEPPEDFARGAVRHKRHAAMRLALRGLLPKAGMLLMLEDDTIVPPDILARLTHVLRGADIATGVQVGRWGARVNGLWSATTRQDGRTVFRSVKGKGVGRVDACGLYALLAEASVYRALDFRTWYEDAGQDVSVTLKASRAGVRIGVDFECGCGHQTPNGIIPPDCGIDFERTAQMLTIQTPSGPFWAPEAFKVKEDTMDRDTYRTHQRVIKGGAVLYGKGSVIKMSEAIELAREGLISDPALGPIAFQGQVLPGVDSVADAPAIEVPEVPIDAYVAPVAPGLEVKYQEDEAGAFICPTCFKSYKSEHGLSAHVKAKHA